jgi:hypothetical protein
LPAADPGRPDTSTDSQDPADKPYDPWTVGRHGPNDGFAPDLTAATAQKGRNMTCKRLLAFLYFMGPVLLSCGDASVDPQDPGTDGTDYGEPRTYPVAGGPGTAIRDEVSGEVFLFPNGGNGTLTVAPITAAALPGPAEGGQGFKVEYTGSDSIEIHVAYAADQTPMVWIWADPGVSLAETDPSSSRTWVPLEPADSAGNPAVFALIDPGKPSPASGRYALQNPSAKTTYQIWKDKIRKSSLVFTRLATLTELTNKNIEDIYRLLPAALQRQARSEIDVRLKPRVFTTYVGWVSFYHPFVYGSNWSLLTRTVDPYFTYAVLWGTIADPSTVAHEVGHYMSHVLLGDDAFDELSGQAVRTHDVSDPHQGRPMLEEYAMFSDYSVYGKVKGGLLMEDPFVTLKEHGSPRTADWPSKEGYATCLLARLHTTENTIVTASGQEPEDIPTVGASLTDLWGILGTGPRTVNGLRAGIGSYLASKGIYDRLPVIMERTGWSYHGTGTIVTPQDKPIPGAKVQAIARVASENREYAAPQQPVTTGEDSTFAIDRLFPGDAFIRVWASPTDSMDFPVRIDADRSTSETIQLGKLVYGRLNDRFAVSSFTETGTYGVFEEPMSYYDLLVLAGMAGSPASCVLALGYYGKPGSRKAHLFYYPEEGDSETIACGTDGIDFADDVKSGYSFTGNLGSGSFDGTAVTSAIGRKAVTWYECRASIADNKVTGTLVYHSRRYIPDPGDAEKVVLQSEGSKTFSFGGTRK